MDDLKAPATQNLRHTLLAISRDTRIHFKEAEILQVAAALAYTTILSIIPALAVSFAIFQAFGGLQKLSGLLEPLIIENLAEGADQHVIDAIQNFVSNAHAATIGAVGFLGLLFTSMTMLNSIEKGINKAWRTPLKRSLFHRFATYWLFITLGPVALAVALGVASSAVENISDFAHLLPNGIGLFFIAAFGFFCVYKWVPNTKVHWLPALISSLVTTVLWNFARLAYSLYTHKIVTYHRIYGSLGAVPLLLLWIYIVWVITLSGAALTASIQKRVKTP